MSSRGFTCVLKRRATGAALATAGEAPRLKWPCSSPSHRMRFESVGELGPSSAPDVGCRAPSSALVACFLSRAVRPRSAPHRHVLAPTFVQGPQARGPRQPSRVSVCAARLRRLVTGDVLPPPGTLVVRLSRTRSSSNFFSGCLPPGARCASGASKVCSSHTATVGWVRPPRERSRGVCTRCTHMNSALGMCDMCRNDGTTEHSIFSRNPNAESYLRTGAPPQRASRLFRRRTGPARSTATWSTAAPPPLTRLCPIHPRFGVGRAYFLAVIMPENSEECTPCTLT